MNSFLPNRIEAVAGPRRADAETLRLCRTEIDAILGSIQLSGLTYREIATRIGVSKSIVNAWAHGERALPDKRLRAFCCATGTMLVAQWKQFDTAMREAEGRQRESDRIHSIIAPTIRAWAA